MLSTLLILSLLYSAYIAAHVLLAIFRVGERYHEALCLAYTSSVLILVLALTHEPISIIVLASLAFYFTAELALLVLRYRNEIRFVTYPLLGSLYTVYIVCMLVHDVASLYALWAVGSVFMAGLLARSRTLESVDASVRYIVYSSLSLAILTIAISCLGLLGHTTYALLSVLGMLGLILGITYEIGVIPLHLWMPDVYLESDKLSVAYLASHMQIFACLVLARLIPPLVRYPLHSVTTLSVALLALVTMTLGNICGIGSDREEHILAFSSIAHAGYVLAAVTCGLAEPRLLSTSLAVALYLVTASAISKYVLFTLLPLPGEHRGRLYSAEVLINVLSLIGVPPLIGFWPKLLLFLLLLRAGLTWLAAALIVNIAMSIVYYMKLYELYRRGSGDLTDRKSIHISVTGGLAGTLLVMALGVFLNVWFVKTLTEVVGSVIF